jgi:hypothetical protein
MVNSFCLHICDCDSEVYGQFDENGATTLSKTTFCIMTSNHNNFDHNNTQHNTTQYIDVDHYAQHNDTQHNNVNQNNTQN